MESDSLLGNDNTRIISESKPAAYYNDESEDADEVVMSPMISQSFDSLSNIETKEIAGSMVDMTELDRLNDEADNELADVEGDEIEKSTKQVVIAKLKKAWEITKMILVDYVWRVLLILFVRNSFYLSLVVCYFADLTSANADLLHAGYCK